MIRLPGLVIALFKVFIIILFMALLILIPEPSHNITGMIFCGILIMCSFAACVFQTIVANMVLKHWTHKPEVKFPTNNNLDQMNKMTPRF